MRERKPNYKRVKIYMYTSCLRIFQKFSTALSTIAQIQLKIIDSVQCTLGQGRVATVYCSMYLLYVHTAYCSFCPIQKPSFSYTHYTLYINKHCLYAQYHSYMHATTFVYYNKWIRLEGSGKDYTPFQNAM